MRRSKSELLCGPGYHEVLPFGEAGEKPRSELPFTDNAPQLVPMTRANIEPLGLYASLILAPARERISLVT